jgi:hypothetical protein
VADPVIFDRSSAERIANAVRRVEIGDRTEAPLSFAPIPIAAGGSKLKFALYTATSNWIRCGYADVTTAQNVQRIQFAFPTATAVVTQSGGATAIVNVSAGPTAMCVNHLVSLGFAQTVSTAQSTIRRIVVVKEAGMWRLLGGDC